MLAGLLGGAPGDKPAKKQKPSERTGKKRGKEEEETSQNEVLIIMVKSILQNSQSLRSLTSCVWTTWLVPASWVSIKEGKQAARQYADEVKKRGKNHDMGAPHPHILAAFVGGLAEQGKKGKEEAKEKAMVLDGAIDEQLTIVAAWASKYDSYEQLMKAVPNSRNKMADAQEEGDKNDFRGASAELRRGVTVVVFCRCDRNTERPRWARLCHGFHRRRAHSLSCRSGAVPHSRPVSTGNRTVAPSSV